MITVTDYPVNLRIKLKIVLEIFIKGGSLTATPDRLSDLESEAIAILKLDGYCVLDTKPIEDLEARDQAKVTENEEAIERDLLLIEENDKARERDRLMVQENHKARERDEQNNQKNDHTFEPEGKTDVEIAVLLEGVDDNELEKSFTAKSEYELTASLEINSVDGGDINGRYRFVTEKLEAAGELIAAIMRSVKPKATSTGS